MQLISSTQSRVARSMLSWDQGDLAEAAEIGIQTVRNFESGSSIRATTITKIRSSFEKSGLEFLEDDGVKRRSIYCVPFSGMDSCDKLFDDMLQTATRYDGEVLAFVSSQAEMMESSGFPRRNNLERFEYLHEQVNVRCVLLERAMHPLFKPSFEFETLPSLMVPFAHTIFVYGDKYADVQHAGVGRFICVIYDLPHTAQGYREDINDFWQKAIVLNRTHKIRKRL